MSNFRRQQRTAITTNTSTSSTASTMSFQKAKNSANQEGLDRLLSVAQNAGTPHYILTLQRAMKSVRECPHAITTIDQALQLKFVGERLARILVPTTAPNTSSSTQPITRTAPASKQPTTSKRSRSTAATIATTSTTSSSSTKQQAYQVAKDYAENLQLPSGPWKVWLLVDTREHRSHTVVSRCQQAGIPCEERTLPIGDMTWIARCGDIELVLGTILERKQVADLVGSLFGTRFLEQRLRLKHCGVPQILYLVEGDLTSAPNCSAETLRMAMMETRIPLGFQILQTKHLEDTVRLLKGLHRRIVQRAFPTSFDELPTFAGRNSGGNGRKQRRPSSLLELVLGTPPQPSLGQARHTTFSELKAKVESDREAGTQTVGAIYQAMLKQIPSLSQKKCQAISVVYPTWSHLLADPARKVEAILCGRQTIGPKSAAELELVCCLQKDGTIMKEAKETTKETVVSHKALVSSSSDPSTASTPLNACNASIPSNPSRTRNWLDLTADSPVPTCKPLYRDLNTNGDQKPSAALDLFFSSDDDNDDNDVIVRRKKKRSIDTSMNLSLSGDHAHPVNSCSESADSKGMHSFIRKDINPSRNTFQFHEEGVESMTDKNQARCNPRTFSLSSDDDDDDDHSPPPKPNAARPIFQMTINDKDEDAIDGADTSKHSLNDDTDDHHPSTPRKPNAVRPSFAMTNNDNYVDASDDTHTVLSIHKVTSSQQFLQPSHSNLARLPVESSGADSSFWFSSPSTTHSTPSPKNKNVLRNITNNDVSIVVIDCESSDDEAETKAPCTTTRTMSTTTTATTNSLLPSSQSSSDDDWRSRLAKQMERETIIIDE